MKEKQSEANSEWLKTKYSNLVRFRSSDTLFARFKARGKLIRQSLDTSDLEVAKRKLDDLVQKERGAVENQRDGKLTGKDGLAEFRERGYRVTIAGRTNRKRKPIKERTRNYYEERITALTRSWPEFEAVSLRKVSQRECESWADKFCRLASASAFNHTVSVLRQVMQIAVEAGARYDNPAATLGRMSEVPKKLKLPEPAQFTEFVAEMRRAGGRFSQSTADLVEFLSYGGFRLSESKNVLREDVSLERGKIKVWGDPLNRTKNGEVREVPIIPDMRRLLERILEERPDMKSTDPVMQVFECQKSMDRAAKLVEIARITHHDLRHLFATRCIESGVDIPTVSRWLGHKDGGALAMKVYGHLRDEHSVSMAQRVTFASQAPRNVVALPKARTK